MRVHGKNERFINFFRSAHLDIGELGFTAGTSVKAVNPVVVAAGVGLGLE